jgi:hypothetical protein
MGRLQGDDMPCPYNCYITKRIDTCPLFTILKRDRPFRS